MKILDWIKNKLSRSQKEVIPFEGRYIFFIKLEKAYQSSLVYLDKTKITQEDREIHKEVIMDFVNLIKSQSSHQEDGFVRITPSDLTKYKLVIDKDIEELIENFQILINYQNTISKANSVQAISPEYRKTLEHDMCMMFAHNIVNLLSGTYQNSLTTIKSLKEINNMEEFLKTHKNAINTIQSEFQNIINTHKMEN